MRPLRRWSEEATAGARVAPRVVGSSTVVDGTPATWANVLSVASAADARRVVDTLADARRAASTGSAPTTGTR